LAEKIIFSEILPFGWKIRRLGENLIFWKKKTHFFLKNQWGAIEMGMCIKVNKVASILVSGSYYNIKSTPPY